MAPFTSRTAEVIVGKLTVSEKQTRCDWNVWGDWCGAVTEILHGRAESLDDLREVLRPGLRGSACKYVCRVPSRGPGTERGLEVGHPLQDTRILQFQTKTTTIALT